MKQTCRRHIRTLCSMAYDDCADRCSRIQ